jgi:valyl-tRNA synthetase
VLASAEIDAEAVRARLDARRKELRSEVARAEGKLSNEKFVSRAPAEVVEEEHEKLERYRAELEELSE